MLGRIKEIKEKPLKPYLVGLCAGLYPILFYAGNNYSLVNSWGHLLFFALTFLILPAIGATLGAFFLKKKFGARGVQTWLAFLGFGLFFFFLKVTLFEAPHRKITALILLISALYAYYLGAQHRKFMVLQGLMGLLAVFPLLGQIYHNISLSEKWKEIPEQSLKFDFTVKPNIYLIQPDGLVNFSELKTGYYQYHDASFETELSAMGFTHYPDFRSNYASTLSSNSALMMMKHHYYNYGDSFSEALDARESIVSENHVLKVFKNNDYQTNLISVAPYLLVNHPKMGFDRANFSYSEIGYLSQGFNLKADVVHDLTEYLAQEPSQPQFYFIEFFNPGHIHGRKEMSLGADQERGLWLASMERGQQTLRVLISGIQERDPQGLIMILADHGGFVGYDYTNQIYTKTQDRDLIYSIFSSQLSIKWPVGVKPEQPINFTTSVNVFRLLFGHLSQSQTENQDLEPDVSYVILDDEPNKGVYEYIDQNGTIICNKVEQ